MNPPNLPPPPVGLVGLPEEGVLITGTLQHPMIENHTTNRTVMAYTIRWVSDRPIKTTNAFPAGNRQYMVRPGESQEIGLDSMTVVVVGADGRTPLPRTAVVLDAVVFDDGEVVGPDRYRTLERTQVELTAEHKMGQLLLTEGWAEIQYAAQQDARQASRNGEHALVVMAERSFANRLLTARRQHGHDAAIELAHASEKYPKLWTGKK